MADERMDTRPVTTTDLFLSAILREMREIRREIRRTQYVKPKDKATPKREAE